MIATIWRFLVRAEAIEAFERVYGPRGDWAQLFARAQGYAGTELMKIDGGGDTYLTIDRWDSSADFHAAKTMLGEEYAALDRQCEDYTYEETWLGVFDVVS